MSRLDELLRELCPDGVEYKKLGSICDIISGFPFDSTKFTDNGIRLMRGMNVKRGYFDFSESSNRYWKDDINLEKYNLQANDIVIAMDGIVGSSLGFVLEEQLPLLLVQRVARARANSREEARFIYHYLSGPEFVKYIEKRKTKGTIPHITLNDISEFKIPVPPLEVQSEIVRILDNFTEFTAELTAELTARKKQYTYYRDKLLTFDNSESSQNSVKWYALGDIALIVRGASPRPIKNYLTEDSNGVNWIKIGDATPESKYITSAQEKISSEGAKKSRYVEPGNFILSNSMSFGRPYILKTSGCIHDGWLSISGFEQYLLSDYLYYILISTPVQNEMRKKASFGGAVQNLNADIVRNIKIPVPPLEVQKQLVEILDCFDLLCNDLSEGLPAEIEARQKQYEYYRDKLLNFKEKSVEAG